MPDISRPSYSRLLIEKEVDFPRMVMNLAGNKALQTRIHKSQVMMSDRYLSENGGNSARRGLRTVERQITISDLDARRPRQGDGLNAMAR
jgi:hypothetical protein